MKVGKLEDTRYKKEKGFHEMVLLRDEHNPDWDKEAGQNRKYLDPSLGQPTAKEREEVSQGTLGRGNSWFGSAEYFLHAQGTPKRFPYMLENEAFFPYPNQISLLWVFAKACEDCLPLPSPISPPPTLAHSPSSHAPSKRPAAT